MCSHSVNCRYHNSPGTVSGLLGMSTDMDLPEWFDSSKILLSAHEIKTPLPRLFYCLGGRWRFLGL